MEVRLQHFKFVPEFQNFSDDVKRLGAYMQDAFNEKGLWAYKQEEGIIPYKRIDFTWDAIPLKKSVMEHTHLGYEPDVSGELLSGQYS